MLARASLVVALTLMAPVVANAQATLVSGLGGPAGYGPAGACLSGSDDGSSVSIPLATAFPSGLRFFDRTHTSAFVNVNGNITFSAPVACYTPDAFPIADQPMIAPFWADVDVRNFLRMMAGGRVCDGPEGMTTCPPTTATCTNPTDNAVWYFTEPGRMVVTWDNVGYYQCHDDAAQRAAFQLILTAVAGCGGTTGTDFDVEFRYNRCEWETGDASGGLNGVSRTATCTRALPILPYTCPFGNFPCTGPAPGTCRGVAAQAGFDAGNSTDFVEIMGSRNPGIGTTLCTGSNVTPAEPGVWRFQIRSGAVICPDAGDACTVAGVMGACAMGRTNCVGGGTECVQQVFPEEERCDNLDNDCDGMTDEDGDAAMCGFGFVCRSGACVENCFESSCGGDLVCVDPGVCVEPGCETVSCPEGERCSGGACVPACSGVTCPFGQVCTAGRCIDPCAGLTCDDCTVCDDGTCVARCSASSCGAGETCDTASGACVPAGCVGVTCPTGEHCAGGTCVDSCSGVSCPIGQTCMAGTCVSMSRPDGGMPVDVGMIFPDSGPLPDGGTPPGMDAGPSPFDAGRAPVPPGTRGCSCRVGTSASPTGLLGLGLVVALLVARRRR